MTQFRIRRATLADRDVLVAFNGDVLRYQDATEPDAGIAAWTADLLDGRHPHVGPDDFCVVEDTRSGRIVSSLCLISQTWSYGRMAIGVGQPELVGTHPDYRGQGLVRRQFAVLHEWSATRGQQLQAIDGIPGFYHQFGYQMALALRDELSIEVAKLQPATGATASYTVRAATESDIAFMAATADDACSRYVMAACRDARVWRYELQGHSRWSQPNCVLAIIEAPDGSPVGFLAHAPRLSGTFITLVMYELIPSASWASVTPSVLQYLRATGEAYAATTAARCDRIGLCLGRDHPAYATIQHLSPRDEGAYAWQLRVPDVPDFLRHVAPVLERRLEQSAVADYSGQLHVSFYRDGVRMTFERGHLMDVAPWQVALGLQGIEKGVASTAGRADASFPGRTFLQLMFGYRSLDELQHAFPDCLVRHDAARALLPVLFPQAAIERLAGAVTHGNALPAGRLSR